MELKLGAALSLLMICKFASGQSSSDDAVASLDPTLHADDQESPAISSNVVRRQVPWFLPQPYLTIPLYPNFRATWRFCPCPPSPISPSYLPPIPPTTTPPSDFDDPNEVLDRMGGVDDRAKSPSRPREPTRCTWAVVACCSPGSRDIRYSCFELLGCPGAFWDVNPCDEKVVMAAANSALNFYSAKTNATTNATE